MKSDRSWIYLYLIADMRVVDTVACDHEWPEGIGWTREEVWAWGNLCGARTRRDLGPTGNAECIVLFRDDNGVHLKIDGPPGSGNDSIFMKLPTKGDANE